MRIVLAGLGLAVAIGSVAVAAGAPSVIVNPEWLQKPDGEDLQNLYPDRARNEGTNGRATVECAIEASGTLTNCTIVEEAPAGYGFGDATLRATVKFRISPPMVDGKPVSGATVQIPIIWSVGSGVLPPRTNTLDPTIVAANPVVISTNSAFYPRDAAKAKLNGKAVVECLVLTNHGVSDCTVLAAAPTNQGFEEAALRRIATMKVMPNRATGETAGRKVRFPVYWRAQDSRASTVDMQRDGNVGVQPPAPPGRQ